MTRRRIGALSTAVAVVAVGIVSLLFLLRPTDPASQRPTATPGSASDIAADFAYLAPRGNSNCSAAFSQSIASMTDGATIRGSCCGPMNMHVYSEERAGILAKFARFAEVPLDPYNISGATAKQMMPHINDSLAPQAQAAYDYALAHSNNKGPCCCPCWRWTFYGGLAKYLIETYGFTGEQVTELWNFSDGCGGEDEHIYHG